MLERLRNKLQDNETYYSREEVDWLLAHIGDPDPAIRDDLVYQTWCQAIGQGFLRQEDYHYLVRWCLEENSLFDTIEKSGLPTLRRSFTALLQVILLWADDEKESRYHHLMTDDERQTFFTMAIDYLTLEKDDRAYVENVGWVHAIAHGADLLVQASSHSDFPSSAYGKLLPLIENIFLERERRFRGDEELRLAPLVFANVLTEKLRLREVTHWLDHLNWPRETEVDWDRYFSFRYFLLNVYLELDRAGVLTDQTKVSFYRLMD
ncbi:DUF2785 domain-containing protein [Streptococcus ovuberis]|uniref:DUF2785 domain-containing protein n=1 Tax=Streptococcus ovuberis TaxID=1936207 RepID=A0A7X6S1H9_9STRE|nr:DUF2785 domain-containing protein [Streptococcus ovuberis]NKZ21273.1 DUF2785 domain-containing protein [Streptococcus ovuberis]